MGQKFNTADGRACRPLSREIVRHRPSREKKCMMPLNDR